MATRSLGTLTLDLIAKIGGFDQGLDKADRSARKTSKSIVTSMNSAAKAVVGFGLAGAGIFVKMTADVVSSAREIKNLAAVANASTTDFQKITFASERFGLEQEKVADILKDTSDKVGDFLQTGGGPLADFFENIAPLVGVTADQFRDLSGPEAMGLYVRSLEQANLSQNEMTFFMEAIASDATLLLPLFKNNAAELNRLGSEAERFGNVISEVDIARLEEIDIAVTQMTQQFAGLKTELVVGALPAIQEFVTQLTDPDTVESATALGNALVLAFTTATTAILGTVDAVHDLSEGLAAAIFGPAADDIARMTEKLDELEIRRGVLLSRSDLSPAFLDQELAALDEEINKYKQLIEFDKVLTESQTKLGNDSIGTIVDIPDPRQALPTGSTGIDKTELRETIEALQLQAELLGKTNDEITLLDLKSRGATEAQLEMANAALQAVSVFETELEAQKALADEMERINFEASAIFDSLRTEEEAIEASYERRREIILANTEFTGQAQTELLARLEADRQEQIQAIEQEAIDKRNAEVQAGYDALFGIVGSYYDGLQGEQAAAARVALSIADALLDEDKRTALQSVIANTQEGVMKAYGDLGPIAGTAAAFFIAAAGAASAAKITGLAHDGIDRVPKTGTFLLEAGERVTTERTSAKLDSTLEDIKKDQAEGGSGGNNIRIVNAFDSQVIGDYMGGPEGEEQILNVVKRNPTVIQAVGRSG